MARPMLLGAAGTMLAAYVAVSQILVPGADRNFNTVVHEPPYTVSSEAADLHKRLFVADLHSDMLLWARNPERRYTRGHMDLPRLIDGNVALQVFAAVTKSPKGQNYDRNSGDSDRITALVISQGWPVNTWNSLLNRALHQSVRLHRAAARSDDRLLVIRTRADLDSVVTNRQNGNPSSVGGLLAIEGLHALEGDLSNIERLFDAGFRMMGLAHMFDNEVAGSAHGVEKGGLTELGRNAVKRMEELGIVIDLAHSSEKVIDDVLMLATKPVVVSHTGVDGTCDGPRNLSDRQIDAIALNGGVIGIGYWEGAVCETSVAAIVRAIRYVADRVGVEHVAFGSDFDGTVHTPFDTSGLAQITEGLMAGGLTEDEIRLISGGNVVRVLAETLPAGEK